MSTPTPDQDPQPRDIAMEQPLPEQVEHLEELSEDEEPEGEEPQGHE